MALESMCELQFYLLFMVSPSILTDVMFFMLELWVVIVQLHLCFLHMCMRWHFV